MGAGAIGRKELSLAAEFNQNIESSVLKEFTVKIYGDTAVVWFTRQVAGLSKGSASSCRSSNIDVFVFRAGKWSMRRQSEHASEHHDYRSLVVGLALALSNAATQAVDTPADTAFYVPFLTSR